MATTSVYTCGSHLSENYYISGYYTYPDHNIDVSSTPVNSTININVGSYDVPNRFSVYDANGNFMASSGWMGYATYSGPWGMSLNTAQSQTINFNKNTSNTYILKVETSISGYSDSWDASISCPVSPDLSYLKPKSNSIITRSHSLYTSFVNATGIFQKYPSLSITNQNLDLVILTDTTIKVIVIQIAGVGYSNKLVAVCNTKLSKYKYYFMEYSRDDKLMQVSAKTFNQNNSHIFSTIHNASTYNLMRNMAMPWSCFGDCIDRQEAWFESSFVGWLFWNMLPVSVVVQTMAAINCEGCCDGWWSNKGC